jgi:D-glycero-D-manno-heptose 1,7-bisphosphate phosphatase
MNASRRRAAVFLDRDGVLNRSLVVNGKPHAPRTLAEFELLPGIGEALNRLKAAGFALVVTTNQPDVRTGKAERRDVEAMHDRLKRDFPIDAIYACYHVEADGCDCRKPKPGMLVEAADAFGLDLKASFMVGDRWRDVGAGRAAGCGTVFIDLGYAEAMTETPDHTVADLPAAASTILALVRT